MTDKPDDLAHRFFRACLLILGGVIALNLAVDVLRCIWVWLAIAAAGIAVIWAAIRWLRGRTGRW